MNTKLKTKQGKKFDELTLIKWSKEIILGINFLHENNIIHCNIDPEYINFLIWFIIIVKFYEIHFNYRNIFLKNKQIKIGGFGSANDLSLSSLVLPSFGPFDNKLYKSREMLYYSTIFNRSKYISFTSEEINSMKNHNITAKTDIW